ncbi:MAG: response regulator [Deltaproteobacteria bacterium]|nr:response regulator [Deltaproteobacteria bacterium]
MDNRPPDKNLKDKSLLYEKQIEKLEYAEKLNYTLYDISNAVNTTRNPEELYQSIYNSLNKLMPLPNFFIAMYDNKNETINFEYFIDEYDDDFPIIENLEEPNCLTGEVILAGRPLFLKENMLRERAKKNKIIGIIPKIWLGVPLIIQDKVIGVICVQHYTEPDYFSHKHLEFLICVSDLIAIAIERKQTLYALEKQEKTLSLILDTTPDSILITNLEERALQRSKMDSISTLASDIAHDFNNLLSSIMGHLELLSIDQTNLFDSQKENIANALISSQKAAKLVRQLQALTKSNGSAPSNIDIYKIIADVFNILEQTTNPLIRKRIELKENQFFVEGYEDELHQAFMHLGMNAIQAIKKKGLPSESFIKFYASQKNHINSQAPSLLDSNYLHFCFQDTGCGMTHDIKKKAFDPMFSTKETGDKKGRGLGLAMVYYIITKKHGGSIDIETKEDYGTIFHIYLPVAGMSGFKTKKGKQAQKSPETILVVEDEDMVRDMAVNTLKSFGYNTIEACDGEAGLGIYKKNHRLIDAVLLDIIMPKMSGVETFKQMLKINPGVKVIITSGHITNQDQKKIFTKASGYLDKPYQIMELNQALRSILD